MNWFVLAKDIPCDVPCEGEIPCSVRALGVTAQGGKQCTGSKMAQARESYVHGFVLNSGCARNGVYI